MENRTNIVDHLLYMKAHFTPFNKDERLCSFLKHGLCYMLIILYKLLQNVKQFHSPPSLKSCAWTLFDKQINLLDNCQLNKSNELVTLLNTAFF